MNRILFSSLICLFFAPFLGLASETRLFAKGNYTCMAQIDSKVFYAFEKKMGIQKIDLETGRAELFLKWNQDPEITQLVASGGYLIFSNVWGIYRMKLGAPNVPQKLKIPGVQDSTPIFKIIVDHNAILVGCEKGLFESKDEGTHWKNIWLANVSNTRKSEWQINSSDEAVCGLAVDPTDGVLYSTTASGKLFRKYNQQWEFIYRFPTTLFGVSMVFDQENIYIKGSLFSVQIYNKVSRKPFKVALSEELKRDGFLLDKESTGLFLYDNTGKKFEIKFDAKAESGQVLTVENSWLVYNIYQGTGLKYYCTDQGIFSIK